MKQKTAVLVLLTLVLAIAPLVLAQQPAPNASPGPTVEPSAKPAIAYSEMQKPVPEPVPQPAPEPVPPSKQQQQPEDRQSQQREAQPSASQAQQDAARTLNGTIVKDGERFVLRTSDSVNFQLDDQKEIRGHGSQSHWQCRRRHPHDPCPKDRAHYLKLGSLGEGTSVPSPPCLDLRL